MRGEQAVVPITGQNAKRVLFGVINPRTGRRVLMRAHGMRQEAFQAFLRLLRRRYSGRPIWLVMDEASCHTAKASRQLAAQLGITSIWLPKQCSELNSMDHLWRELKGKIAANRQFLIFLESSTHANENRCNAELIALQPRCNYASHNLRLLSNAVLGRYQGRSSQSFDPFHCSCEYHRTPSNSPLCLS